MNVLIACENSGIIRDTFAARGHNAWSCDLLPSDREGQHYRGDIRDALSPTGFFNGPHPIKWDLMIAHPDCTYLTVSAEWCYKDEQKKTMRDGVLYGAERRAARVEALAFVQWLMDLPVPRIAIENPVGVIGSRIKKASQYIQPYEYGHDASKRTGLWLKGLPLLAASQSNRVSGRIVTHNGKQVERWANQTDSGQNRLAPSVDRWKLRAETYQGWADAMADQWGRL